MPSHQSVLHLRHARLSYAQPRRARQALAAVLLLVLGGCTASKFAVANLPAWTLGTNRSTAVYAEPTGPRLDVYVPDPVPRAGATRPVVVFIHGGSWQQGSRRQYAFVGNRLARAGYVTVIPDYRKFPQREFPALVGDVARAVAWTRRNLDRYGGDPGRIFLMGHSAGAHLAALVALDPRYLVAEGLGTATVRGVIGLAGPYDFELTSDELRAVFAGSATTGINYRPRAFVSASAPPMLLIHGSADEIVEPGNAGRLADALRAAAVPVTVQLLPGGGHGAPLIALSPFAPDNDPVLPAINAFIDALPARAAIVGGTKAGT